MKRFKMSEEAEGRSQQQEDIRENMETSPTPSTSGLYNLQDQPTTSRNNALGIEVGAVKRRSGNKFQIVNTKPPAVKNKSGIDGTPVELSANYFKLSPKSNFELHLYEATFMPEVEEKSVRRRLVREQKKLLGFFIYDGIKTLYTFQRLQEERYEITVKASESGVEENILKLQHCGKIELTSSEALKVLNIILRRTMNGLNLQLVGRNLFNPSRAIKFEQFNLELWPGFITSIRSHEEDVMVCCEVSHRVMRGETVLEVMKNVRENSGGDWQENFKRTIIGAVVLTGYNNRTYRVDDVNFGESPKSKFVTSKLGEISFGFYYKKKYNQIIQDRDQPLLVSNPTRKDIRDGRTQVILLVPELCRMTGLNEKMRSNYKLMNVLAEHTQQKPEIRCKALVNFSKSLKETQKSFDALNESNLQIDENLVRLQGREFKQETIIFGNDKSFLNNDQVDWTQHIRSNKMFSCQDLGKTWGVVYPAQLANETDNFLRVLETVARNMNYNLEPPKLRQKIDRPNNDTYRDALESMHQANASFVLVALVNNSAQLYSFVKHMTCVKYSIPSQVIVGRSLKNPKGLMTVATKVCVQINCKLGGAPWMINFPMTGVMTVGFDVTHDTRDKRKSIGALVATTDLRKEVKFFSGIIENNNREELSSEMPNMLAKAIESYSNLHKMLPQRIIFYRDGVGDGQIEHVHQIELNEIKSILDKIKVKFDDPDSLKLTFVIVNKRINTRIFLGNSGNYQNPKPGTVVDTTITLPERYDFYLVSQSTRIGTVSPTSYNVIEDESGLTPGRLQTLTYKNCHLYYNWSGTVRVPAVVQYAHKLAFLVGQHLHSKPLSVLGDIGSLYFL